MKPVVQIGRTLSRVGAHRLTITIALLLAALLLARETWHAPLALDAERAMYDIRALIAAPRVDQDRRIVMVVYKDETLERTGRRSPLDRTLLAQALTNIDRLGARAIGIDILIDQPEPEDPVLVAAMRAMRTPTFLAFAAARTNADSVLPWQERFERQFEAALVPGNVHPASIRLEADADNVMRRWPSRPTGLPPLMVDRMSSGVGAFGRYDGGIAYRLPRVVDRPVFEILPIDLFDTPESARMLASQIAGRHVLVGGDISDVDRFDTPATRLTHATTSGLEIHATLLAQRLDGRAARPLSRTLLWALAVLVILCGAALGFLEIDGWALLALIGASVAVLASAPFLLQAWGVDTQKLPAFGWLIGWALAYSAAAGAARSLGSEQRKFAQGALGRYLPRDVAASILRDPDQLSLHGERTTIFALFSDLEGFTKLTHAIAPETVAVLLNRYLDMLSNIVLAHGGTIDKFVGDAVVAFWGAPIAREGDGDRALDAAIAIVEAGESFRRSPPAEAPPIGRTRVGLHRGEAIVGNFGGEGRIQYTALGDAMNVAARLEGANKPLATRALVSAEAAAGMTDPPLRPMGRVCVRGRSTPIAVFEPVPAMPRDELAVFRRLFEDFDAGGADALTPLDTLARAAPDDEALQKFVHRLNDAGPGGYVALD